MASDFASPIHFTLSGAMARAHRMFHALPIIQKARRPLARHFAIRRQTAVAATGRSLCWEGRVWCAERFTLLSIEEPSDEVFGSRTVKSLISGTRLKSETKGASLHRRARRATASAKAWNTSLARLAISSRSHLFYHPCLAFRCSALACQPLVLGGSSRSRSISLAITTRRLNRRVHRLLDGVIMLAVRVALAGALATVHCRG
ncbi:hypothetical protein BKA80DRAFT_276073 [Phyllosticta citrichinensis]